MKRLYRLLLTLLIGLGIAALPVAGTAQAGTATSAVATYCTDHVDIGYTVYDPPYIKGSGSYTSCPGHAIRRVYVALWCSACASPGWAEKSGTRVTKYPANGGGSDPNAMSFSAKPYRCVYYQYIYWKTRIVAVYVNGDVVSKFSNTIYKPCS